MPSHGLRTKCKGGHIFFDMVGKENRKGADFCVTKGVTLCHKKLRRVYARALENCLRLMRAPSGGERYESLLLGHSPNFSLLF